MITMHNCVYGSELHVVSEADPLGKLEYPSYGCKSCNHFLLLFLTCWSKGAFVCF